MKNWDDRDEKGFCSSDKEFEDAQLVADKLKIPLKEVNFVKSYWNEIFTNFIREYEEGLTPNPDVLCNRVIKYNLFYKSAIEKFNCDAIATGHYARTSFGNFLENYKDNEDVRLKEAADTFKDQTFFLSQVPQNALRRCMFPVGSLNKLEVKQIAEEIGLKTIAKKNESTGLCFVGKRSFQSFIAEFIEDKPGNFVDIDTGKVIGVHSGVHHWTLGQRTKMWGPKGYFVYKKDPSTRTIYATSGTEHHLLFSDIFFTANPFWISKDPFAHANLLECQFRFQHTKPKINCKVFKANKEGSKLLIKLDEPLRSISPGQYAVLYKDGECLGSSRITDSGTGPMTREENMTLWRYHEGKRQLLSAVSG
jgi:tRNA (5-methylaminomethyl-2-thiouridylate)-methyltransferase